MDPLVAGVLGRGPPGMQEGWGHYGPDEKKLSGIDVESPSPTGESLEEIKSHPTISQDWTDQATVDNNRLVALQEKRLGAQSNKRGGQEVEKERKQTDRNSPVVIETPKLEDPRLEEFRRHQLDERLARISQQALRDEQRVRAMRVWETRSRPTQDQGHHLDCSSSEDEDDMESPNSEDYRSAVSKDIPHSSYMAELRKASRSERRRPCLQQPYKQDETTLWSPPFNETNKTDYELKKMNGLSGNDRHTRHRVKDQSTGQYSCNHSHPAPISRTQSP